MDMSGGKGNASPSPASGGGSGSGSGPDSESDSDGPRPRASPRGTPPTATSRSPTGAIWVVTQNDLMAACLVAGLNHLGWSASATRAVRLPRHPAGNWVTSLVLVADGSPSLPDLGRLGGVHPCVVAVGATDDARWLAMAIDRGASVAINLEQPLPALLHDIADRLRAPSRGPGAQQAARLRSVVHDSELFSHLTAGEQEVLGGLVLGLTADQIAQARHVSIATVRSQIQSILGRLGLTSQVAAIALAHRACLEPGVRRQVDRLHQF